MNEKRKHRQQMTPAEIAAVENVVHAQECWLSGGHAVAQMETKGIYGQETFDTLHTGHVVEVNNTNDLCILMRKDFPDHSVCVVASLATRFIVTAWKNGVYDSHTTLDLNRYQWEVDLVSEMAPFTRKG